MSDIVPTVDVALRIAADALKAQPLRARRFATGLRHFVFDVEFADRPAVVVRIGLPSNRDKIQAAVHLSAQLRPLGVPLPAVLAHETAGVYPFMIIERFDGADLGDVMDRLSEAALDSIAAKVVAAQTLVATLPTVGRYGYAFRAEDAPHDTWSKVLDANLAGCRARMTGAGLFKTEAVDLVSRLVEDNRRKLDALGATAFMHDTTTKNVIVTESGAFSGIVDVDSLCWGDTCYPAALTMASILFRGGRPFYVHAWMRYANRPLDRLFWIYVCQFLVTFMSEYGQTFNQGVALALAEGEKASLLRAFSGALARV